MVYPSDPGFVYGSDTSEAAAESMDKSAAGLRMMVFNYISDLHLGATCDECEVVLGLRHQTASARIRELVIMGVITDTGHRRATRSGRSARVYRTAVVEI